MIIAERVAFMERTAAKYLKRADRNAAEIAAGLGWIDRENEQWDMEENVRIAYDYHREGRRSLAGQ